MSLVNAEAKTRLNLAKNIAEDFSSSARGILLAGSVAYAPHNVTSASDVDLLMVVEDIKKVLPLLPFENNEREALMSRFFDGYAIKQSVSGVPMSIHVLSTDAFDVITKCFVADIRLYRPKAKEQTYDLRGFDGRSYDYKIKNIHLDDLLGVRVIVPVSFIYEDRYYLGVHRDKLLSSPVILKQQDRYLSSSIDHLWSIVVENLYDEANRLEGAIDLSNMNVLNALSRKDKMSNKTKGIIVAKTREYLSNIKQ